MLLSIALVVGASVLWSQLLSKPDCNLRVYFLDVGQGDSTLIVTPRGKQVLVDGGPGAESAAESLSGKLPLGDRSLDLVVLTHLDDDHSRGLFAILERYSVGALMVGNRMADSPRFTPWQAVLDRRGIRRIDVESGFQVELEPGVVIDVLNPQRAEGIWPPKDRNNDSVVLRLVYERARFLLAADIEAEAEGFLARNSPDLDSAVLKVSHHGSGTSTTRLFLDRVSPLVAVVSAGKDNSFGHPDPNVIDRLEGSVGVEGVYRTDQHGTVEIITDGSTLWVRAEKQLPSASPE
jgi:competence protein ComEC